MEPISAAESNFAKISSRDYGNPSSSASYNYYTTNSGHPSYGSSGSGSFSDFYNPPDYSGYFSPTQDTKKKPTYPTYPTYPASYYPSGTECQDQMMNNVIGDILQTGGVAKSGLLRSIVAAITAGILAKIPIILAIKALIVKLILVPLGFIILSLPIILPILLLFSPLWTKLKETFTGTTAAAPTMVLMMAPSANITNSTQEGTKARARSLNYSTDILLAILESDRCFEKLACQLGSRDANSSYIKPVSWLLKFLQTFKFVQTNIEIRSVLKRYRDAYLQGIIKNKKISDEKRNSTDFDTVCTEELYPCNTPVLYSRPEFTGYSRYL